ncbi:hypothetical protein NL676_013468 [Syzygium grande]|nr:hypothetical protein NL676_013468 [Syzygium grande]
MTAGSRLHRRGSDGHGGAVASKAEEVELNVPLSFAIGGELRSCRGGTVMVAEILHEEPRLRHHAGPPPAALSLGTTDAAASGVSVRWPKDIPQRERESSPRPPTVTVY